MPFLLVLICFCFLNHSVFGQESNLPLGAKKNSGFSASKKNSDDDKEEASSKIMLSKDSPNSFKSRFPHVGVFLGHEEMIIFVGDAKVPEDASPWESALLEMGIKVNQREALGGIALVVGAGIVALYSLWGGDYWILRKKRGWRVWRREVNLGFLIFGAYAVGAPWPWFISNVLPNAPEAEVFYLSGLPWVLLCALLVVIPIPIICFIFPWKGPYLYLKKRMDWFLAAFFFGIGVVLVGDRLVVSGSEFQATDWLLTLEFGMLGYGLAICWERRRFLVMLLILTTLYFLTILSYSQAGGLLIPGSVFGGLVGTIYLFRVVHRGKHQSLSEGKSQTFLLDRYIRVNEHNGEAEQVLQGQSDRIQFVAIEGAPHMGKEAFFKEYLEPNFVKSHLKSQVLSCGITDGKDIPLGALAPLLRSLRMEEADEQYQGFFMRWAGKIPMMESVVGVIEQMTTVDPRSVFFDLEDAVISLARQKPLLLFLKRLDLFDPVSLEFIEHLRNALIPHVDDNTRLTIQVVATFSDIPSDSHWSALFEKFKDEQYSILNWKIASLKPVNKNIFINAMGEMGFTESVLRAMRPKLTKSNYNLGTAIEYFRVLAQEHRIWALDSDENALEMNVAEFDETLLTEHGPGLHVMQALSDQAKQILQVAAVMGFGHTKNYFNRKVIGHVLKISELELIETLKNFEVHWWIVSIPKRDGWYSFKMPGLRLAVLDSMGKDFYLSSAANPTLRYFHRELLEFYEKTAPEADDSLRPLAIHSRYFIADKSDLARTFSYNFQYASQLYRQFNIWEAIRVLNWLEEQGDQNFESHWLRNQIRIETHQSKEEAWDRVLIRLASLERSSDQEWKAKFLVQKALHFYQHRAFDQCRGAAQKAIPLAQPGTLTFWRAEFYDRLALAPGTEERLNALKDLEFRLDKGDSRSEDRDVIRMKAELLDALAREYQALHLTIGLRVPENDPHFVLARNSFEESLRLKKKLFDKLGQAITIGGLGELYYYCLDSPEAQSLAFDAYHEAYVLNSRNHFFRGLLGWYLGWIREQESQQCGASPETSVLQESFKYYEETTRRAVEAETPELRLKGISGMIRITELLPTLEHKSEDLKALFEMASELLDVVLERSESSTFDSLYSTLPFPFDYEQWEEHLLPLESIAERLGIRFP